MAAIYEKEYRLQFASEKPSGIVVVFSGSVQGFEPAIGGSDASFNNVNVTILVGPYWRDVQEVVPFVTLNGVLNTNSDEDDALGWLISDLKWDTEGGTGDFIDEERIRLKFTIALRGEYTSSNRVGYYVTARGRRLGHLGIKAPK
jgi:hypothetical protein